MNIDGFDKQAKAHLAIYNNFMNASKVVIALIIVTLVVMAATLL